MAAGHSWAPLGVRIAVLGAFLTPSHLLIRKRWIGTHAPARVAPRPAQPVRPDRRPAHPVTPIISRFTTSHFTCWPCFPFFPERDIERERERHLLALVSLPPSPSLSSPSSSVSCRNRPPLLPAAGHFGATLALGLLVSSWRFPLGCRLGFTRALSVPPFGGRLERRGGSLVHEARRRRRQPRRRVIFGLQTGDFFFPPGLVGRKEAAASTRDVHGLDLAVRRRGSERGFGGGIGCWSLSPPHFE